MKKNNMIARHEAAIAAKLKAEYDAQLDIALQMGLDAMENDKRLIDINPIIRNLTAMKSMYDAIALDGMIKALEDAPTVDAVEVVRCKDCVYWGQDACSSTGDDESFCTNPDGLDNFAHPDDFCSYGERRNDNAAD